MDLITKLQLKAGQRLDVVHAPKSLDSFVDELKPTGTEPGVGLLIFLTDRSGLENERAGIVAVASADRLTWVAYPKGGQLGTDLNRDSLAGLLSESGVQPVRQISIDDVWSALRFRPG